MRRKIQVKKHFIIIAIAISFCLFAVVNALNYPPISHKLLEDTSDYMNVNSFVREKLVSDFGDPLSDQVPVGSRLERYCYQYDCGLLGDASFYINFMVVFNGDNELNSKYVELMNANPYKVLTDNSVDYIVFKGTAESFAGYLDGEIFDGALWRFYIVSIDRESRSMEYTISYIFDGSNRNEHLTDTVSRVNYLLTKNSN